MDNNFQNRYIIVNARFLTQPITGVQRFAIEICRLLINLIPNIRLVAPPNIRHKELAKELKVEIYGKLSSHFWEQLELPLYLHKLGNPLLLNLCNTAPVYYSNKVVCIHDLAVFINPQWFSKSFALFYRSILPQIARRSKKVLTVSQFSKTSLQSILNIPAQKIDVVYNSVSEAFAGNGLAMDKNKYGRYILAVSSLEPRKNLNNLIKGFKRANLSETKLVIVGAGSKVFNNPGLKELVQEDPDIIFTGYVPDAELAGIYHNALMFVYPSLFEGFGIPPLEAMQCGCPTVVSDTSSLPEVCADASLYVNPLDSTTIAAAIKLLSENEERRKELILKGFARAKDFSWQRSAEKLAGIINILL